MPRDDEDDDYQRPTSKLYVMNQSITNYLQNANNGSFSNVGRHIGHASVEWFLSVLDDGIPTNIA